MFGFNHLPVSFHETGERDCADHPVGAHSPAPRPPRIDMPTPYCQCCGMTVDSFGICENCGHDTKTDPDLETLGKMRLVPPVPGHSHVDIRADDDRVARDAMAFFEETWRNTWDLLMPVFPFQPAVFDAD